jgi:hypothetical protein
LPRFLRKGAVAALLVLAVGALALGGTRFFRERYQKQLWDSNAAALVNGVPISRESVEAVLRSGFYPPLTAEEAPGALSVETILERLIEEELVRQAALERGISVSEEETRGFLEEARLSWGCQGPEDASFGCRLPKGEALDSLIDATQRRLLLRKLFQSVFLREGRRASRDWEKYLLNWSETHSLPTLFAGRALLTEKTPRALRILDSPRYRRGGLDALTQKLEEEGLAFLLSETMRLDARPGKAAALFPTENLGAELTMALEDPQKLTRALPLAESYWVFAVSAVVPRPSPEKLARAALRDYESAVADAAFKAFLHEQRGRAAITVNPNFPGSLAASLERPQEKGQPAAEAE